MTRRNTPLQIKLTPLSNSKVKASMTNMGSEGFNLFYTGSFLDSEAPIDRLIVHGTATRARFMGLLVQVSMKDPIETQFLPILPGQTIDTIIDMAELYDMEVSDRYTIQARGSLPFAELGSTRLTGLSLPYASNVISMDVDGAEAAKVPYAVLNLRQKRAELECSSERNAILKQARESCAMLAGNAAKAAQSGRLMQEYFKSTSDSVVSQVVQRFNAVAEECASNSAPSKSSVSCTDVNELCSKPGYIAYTNPSSNVITYCDIFYEGLGALTGQCGVQDQANTVVHETTHCPDVFSPYTLDYAYGPAVTNLNSDQAVLNADTYRMYAGAIFGNCSDS
ncbi:related to Neutral protease 2 homolog SNOG_10522 [Ramularia collo-cygni]|uniref:Neutral protease 2 n=1 Tax=Ramularia collo-cygni TaxID=112498 RepID=A0A2D3VHY7_9PEZI|nr:related to Neutral protease 2 homolog SNOG_10522 [Ramularia collo-cygni]CZT25770.1 related to Neutral protease 2 homolog SNOG_10522 [Ramularia collo-cygni]